MAALDDLKSKVDAYNPNADWQLIESAYAFADAAHAGQFRKSGEPYITHPLAVAEIVADMQLDVASIVSALLHDVVEDCDVSLETMTAKFGKEVSSIVEGVTKLEKLNFSSRDEAQVENLRKMFLAMAKDLRVILIKLADRLHNMRTLKHQKAEAQRRIAIETMDIYAPLAHRLGVSEIKWELEDLSFRYMEPDRYQE
ncbi:MAG TPA: HD domain-containing protein, partial [Symbiobacteriaceae bacterium]|nr:HD domain-containing protein [Symbiobacteriaceae bacterium]